MGNSSYHGSNCRRLCCREHFTAKCLSAISFQNYCKDQHRNNSADDCTDYFCKPLSFRITLQHIACLEIVHHITNQTTGNCNDGSYIKCLCITDGRYRLRSNQNDNAEDFHRVNAGLSYTLCRHGGGQPGPQDRNHRRNDSHIRHDGKYKSKNHHDRRCPSQTDKAVAKLIPAEHGTENCLCFWQDTFHQNSDTGSHHETDSEGGFNGSSSCSVP